MSHGLIFVQFYAYHYNSIEFTAIRHHYDNYRLSNVTVHRQVKKQDTIQCQVDPYDHEHLRSIFFAFT